MSKLFRTNEIPQLDRLTIEYEHVASIDLMERAATTVREFINLHYAACETVVCVGPGNNGGDGLAVARMLADDGYSVEVLRLTGTNGRVSADHEANWQRLDRQNINVVNSINSFTPTGNVLIVDALFGTGLSRPLEGEAAELVQRINASQADVVSIDMPSGLGAEDQPIEGRAIVRATHTVVFELPKIMCYLPEAAPFVGKWHVYDIGLSDRAINEVPSPFRLNGEAELRRMLKPRSPFAHKGNMGRAVLVAGARGMMGAAVLASRATLRTGAGLLTTVCPDCGYQILQTAVPEAMCLSYAESEIATVVKQLTHLRPTAIGIGPGLGKGLVANELVHYVMNNFPDVPKVIDADGLNVLSELLRDGETVDLSNCILTPHPIEFERLTETYGSTYERIVAASEFARKHRTTVILKGAYTVVATADNIVTFNALGGNSGLATAGSGDTLTGIALGLLAQGYSSAEAAQLAVGLHSLAGRCARDKYGEHAMIAGDIVDNIGAAFAIIYPKQKR